MPYHRSEEHTSELQSHLNLVCRLLLEKKKYVCACVCVCVCACVWACGAVRACVLYTLRVVSRHLCCAHCCLFACGCVFVFFFNDTATTEIYTLSLHDALPI